MRYAVALITIIGSMMFAAVIVYMIPDRPTQQKALALVFALMVAPLFVLWAMQPYHTTGESE